VLGRKRSAWFIRSVIPVSKHISEEERNMTRTVIVASGTIKDLEAFGVLWKDSVSLVNERLPGTEMYECYIDKDTSRFTMHEEYPGDEAIRRHLEVMTESGVVDRAREVLDLDFVVALGDPLDQKVRSAMGDLGFSFYELHSRAERG
jgi:quinol monooxygenase YgiN